MTHHILSTGAIEASEAGALPGHQATCACGDRYTTSLSQTFATQAAQAHCDYMNAKVR
jgi:hypothetical protein